MRRRVSGGLRRMTPPLLRQKAFMLSDCLVTMVTAQTAYWNELKFKSEVAYLNWHFGHLAYVHNNGRCELRGVSGNCERQTSLGFTEVHCCTHYTVGQSEEGCQLCPWNWKYTPLETWVFELLAVISVIKLRCRSTAEGNNLLHTSLVRDNELYCYFLFATLVRPPVLSQSVTDQDPAVAPHSSTCSILDLFSLSSFYFPIFLGLFFCLIRGKKSSLSSKTPS